MQTIRDQKRVKFLVLRDVSGVAQISVSNPDLFPIVKNLTLESVVKIVGLVKKEPQAPQGIEIVAAQIDVLSPADPELPIPVVEKSRHETDQQKRLDWRWIDLRKPRNVLIFQIWTAMERAFVDWLSDRGYIQIHSPKLMNSPSESKSELFSLPYFETTAYLAQSPQFYKQMAMAAGLEKIFEIGPVYRANPSFTSRHDTEFTMYDLEISFTESHLDVMREESLLICHLLQVLRDKLGSRIKRVFGTEVVVPALPFPQVTMAEAKQMLQKKGVPSEKESDLSPEEERQLAGIIFERFGHEFVFVTEYPVAGRPFYHMRLESDPGLTKSFDLLWKGLEITTGAQREHRYEILSRQAVEKGHNLEKLQHYLNFFKWGCPPHGGLGFGPSRFIMKLLNLANVREVTYLYRGINRLTP